MLSHVAEALTGGKYRDCPALLHVKQSKARRSEYFMCVRRAKVNWV